MKECFVGKQKKSILPLICLCYVGGAILFIVSLVLLYKLNTFVTSQCKVTSIDLKKEGLGFRPRWKIIVMDGNLTRDDLIMYAGRNTPSESQAWDRARQFKKYETYPCYRSRDQESTFSWGWQWEKPSKGIAYSLLCGGVMLIVFATVLLILKLHYRKEFKNTPEQQQQQQQLEIPLRSEEP